MKKKKWTQLSVRWQDWSHLRHLSSSVFISCDCSALSFDCSQAVSDRLRSLAHAILRGVVGSVFVAISLLWRSGNWQRQEYKAVRVGWRRVHKALPQAWLTQGRRRPSAGPSLWFLAITCCTTLDPPTFTETSCHFSKLKAESTSHSIVSIAISTF